VRLPGFVARRRSASTGRRGGPEVTHAAAGLKRRPLPRTDGMGVGRIAPRIGPEESEDRRAEVYLASPRRRSQPTRRRSGAAWLGI
jgi:hypothetical protein